MIIESEIPHTEQGLLDYIRFGKAALAGLEKKNKRLNEMVEECGTRLTKLGWYCLDGKWKK